MAHASMSANPPNVPESSRLVTTVAILVLGYLVFLIIRPFATPLLFAAVMVVIFDPVYQRLETRLRPSLAAALSTFMVVLVIIIPAMLIAGRIVDETIDLAGNVRALRFDVLNVPNPTNETGSPFLSDRVMLSMSDSTAAAALVFVMPVSLAIFWTTSCLFMLGLLRVPRAGNTGAYTRDTLKCQATGE